MANSTRLSLTSCSFPMAWCHVMPLQGAEGDNSCGREGCLILRGATAMLCDAVPMVRDALGTIDFWKVVFFSALFLLQFIWWDLSWFVGGYFNAGLLPIVRWWKGGQLWASDREVGHVQGPVPNNDCRCLKSTISAPKIGILPRKLWDFYMQAFGVYFSKKIGYPQHTNLQLPQWFAETLNHLKPTDGQANWFR